MTHFKSACFGLLLVTAQARADDGNRLTYLDGDDPFYVHREFAKLITPQWVGEPGVEAVVILAIDDMTDPPRYEKFLRPVLQRLKQIDGRAPVSIMTNRVDPRSPLLQKWLAEGLSLETHTFTHPQPLLGGANFAKAKDDYDRCVDRMTSVPGSKPVAFRMPFCDSLNSTSPRFYAEIFNKRTPGGNFLTIDSSVFNIITSDDPELATNHLATGSLARDTDGQDKFRKLIPFKSFATTIEDYPYPYPIGRLCWEFPCAVPSDWEANHLRGPAHPQTVKELKDLLTATVVKRGVLNFVFHPYGWIKSEQLVDFIDYAVSAHGNAVKFLTFRDAQERLNRHLLAGQPLRTADGLDNGVRLMDLNHDGYLDVVIGNGHLRKTRIWQPGSLPAITSNHKTDGQVSRPVRGRWQETNFPVQLVDEHGLDQGARFGVIDKHGSVVLILRNELTSAAWHFEAGQWVEDAPLLTGLDLDGEPILTARQGQDLGVRLRDLDRDGTCELIVSNDRQQAVFAWSETDRRWNKLPFSLPTGVAIVNAQGKDNGVRFVDLDDDDRADVVFSNEQGYSIHLFGSMQTGWSRKVMAGKRGTPDELPMITRHGTNNGAWFHNRELWLQNEDTAVLKDLVEHRPFNDLLKGVEPLAKSPIAALRAFHPRPGFTVELMAQEPLVQSPIAFNWGPDGKLWVVEMGDYPLGVDGKGKAGGRIKFLESTRGDGKYDKATLFLDGLHYPTAVLPWRKGAIVACAPEIFYAEDTDGDGKADVHTPLFVGFNEGNPQHRVNGLVWGLDNWIYCANGDSGGMVRSVKTGAVVDIRGRDFRIKPDEGLIDLQMGQSQFGRNRDDWGNWFGCNNSNPMWQFVLDDHYLRRNPQMAAPDSRVNVSAAPGASPVYPVSRTLPRFNDFWAANRFTSACSVMVYRDERFPQLYGNSFVSEPVHNLVHREIMEPKGLIFSSQRASDEKSSEFLASTDNWFRPTTIKTGPDGAVWIADMYRQVIEHPEWIPPDWQRRIDLRAGQNMGRIYAIRPVLPVGSRPFSIPHFDHLDTPALVKALDSANGPQRDLVQQMLIWRGDAGALPLLEKLAVESSRAVSRMQALCTLDGLGGLNAAILARALSDAHPGVRRHAIRLCEPLLDRHPELGAALLKTIDDQDMQVRLQLAYTLGEWHEPEAARGLGRLALASGTDHLLTTAILSSVNKQNLGAVLLTVLADRPGGPPTEVAESLLQLAYAFGATDALIPLLEKVGQPREGTFAVWQYAALAGLLETLGRRNVSLIAFRDGTSKETRHALEQLSPLFTAARKLVEDPGAAKDVRLLALHLLGRGFNEQPEDVDRLAKFLDVHAEDDMRTEAIAALGQLQDARIPQILLHHWRSYSPAVRVSVLDILFRRPAWLQTTLVALEKKQLDPVEIDPAHRQRLLQSSTTAIREQAARLFAGAINPDRQKVIEAYRSVVTLAGDAKRGQAIFQRTCATCHKLAGIGQEVGPDLGSLGDKSPESMLIAILDPNRAVEARYVSYVALTKNGMTLAGVLTNETGNSITLVGTDGKPQVILRKDLDELSSTNRSAMPEGLERDLKPLDIADVIAFVRAGSPALQRKSFEGNKPETVRPDSRGRLTLSAQNCEIYGSSLVYETQYQNLGYWSSADDNAVWTIDLPRPGKYDVQLHYASAVATAGNRFVLQAGLQRLTGSVQGTGTWDDYRQTSIGTLTLQAGVQNVVFRSEGRIRAGGCLLDLKAITLIAK